MASLRLVKLLAQMRNKTFGKLVGHHWPQYATI